MSLLDPKNWQSQSLSGPEHTITEPATGDSLGTVRLATAEDVETAAVTARAAQTEWARAPGDSARRFQYFDRRRDLTEAK